MSKKLIPTISLILIWVLTIALTTGLTIFFTEKNVSSIYRKDLHNISILQDQYQNHWEVNKSWEAFEPQNHPLVFESKWTAQNVIYHSYYIGPQLKDSVVFELYPDGKVRFDIKAI